MRNLPSEYQEVEYIQSSGTQYIDTGYIPTNNTKVELKMGGWTGFGSYPNLFGARLEWSTTGGGFQLGKTTTGSGDYFAMFGGYLTGLSPSTFSFGDGNDHIIEMSQSGIYEDGALKQSLSSATFTSPTNMVIFADNENGTVSENGAYKLYYCKIYNNGTLVRDFLPCYRKSDGVIGLYDLVNDQFYTNSGTGTFTKGSDVNGAKIQRIYVGDHNQIRPTWKPTSSTLAWRPLKENLNDYSGNNHNFSIGTGSVSYSDNMATFQRLTCSGFSLYNYSGDFTLSLWCTPYTGTEMGLFPIIDSQGYPSIFFNLSSSSGGMGVYYSSWKQVAYSGTYTGVHLITGTKTSSKLTFYIDGVQVVQSSGSYGTTASGSVNNTWLGRNINGTGSWTCGDVIIENRCWTADEIKEYYNQTKGKYLGIS